MLFSVVPFSHNCGTKITLISINKAKSYQHPQRLKSVSVNDLAIDVLGCFWVLFSDAEIPENIPQHLISRYLSDDRAEVVDGFADILGDEVSWDARSESVADAEEGGAGVGEGLDVALVCYQSCVTVGEQITLRGGEYCP